MKNQNGINRSALISLGVLVLIVGGVIGYFIGQMNGNQAATNKYLPIISAAFPAPSGTLYNLTGTVKGVYGATITLTVQDPSDYLPHMDGSPRATQTRTAQTSPNTKFFAIDNSKLNADGSPTKTPITSGDIQTGDTVAVQSSQNIFSATTFDVTEVDLIK